MHRERDGQARHRSRDAAARRQRLHRGVRPRKAASGLARVGAGRRYPGDATHPNRLRNARPLLRPAPLTSSTGRKTLMTRRFEDRTAVVVGGGSGMGRSISLRLAEEGAQVYVADLGTDAAESVTK